jgi:uncharacterized membrane protein
MSTVVSPTVSRAPARAYAPPDPASLPTVGGPASESRRIASIDIIRGAVMVLMAIDHVRVYAGVPAGGPWPGVFFTRWVTNFCAPAFLFLAGTAAFLHGEKIRDRGALARFLVTRGAWLVLLELTVLRFAWTFNFDYAHYTLAGVIWVIGWCMILMAGLVYLPVAAIGAVGVAVIALHNLADPYSAQLDQSLGGGSFAWLYQVLYRGGSIALGGGEDGPQLAVLYSIIPWIGVMAAGYAFGPVLRMDAARRRRICLALGGGAIAAFLVLRGFNIYGDPRPWGVGQRAVSRPPAATQPAGSRAAGAPNVASQAPAAGGAAPAAPQRRALPRMPAALQFLNTAKYPASLLFLLMTLGPTILLVPLLERAHGPVARVMTVFGRVPLFYYVLHIPLIHLIFVGLSIARYGTVIPWMTANHPMFVPPAPPGYMYGLGALYAITAVTVIILYFPCRWFAALKSRRRDWWLSYV